MSGKLAHFHGDRRNRSLALQGVPSCHWRLYTTNFILAETHPLTLNRLGYQAALRVLREIDHSAPTIVRITVADEHRAREIITSYGDKEFSLTDALSFVVMERLGIDQAFTFDRNFSQCGLGMLTPA